MQTTTEQQIQQASVNAIASILNMTFLPGLAFIYLLIILINSDKNTIDHYHARFAIILNLAAALSLIFVSALMLILGGFDSAWTWVYVITYFTLVHTGFIIVAVWAMIRAWSGQKVWSKDQSINKSMYKGNK